MEQLTVISMRKFNVHLPAHVSEAIASNFKGERNLFWRVSQSEISVEIMRIITIRDYS